MIPFSALQTLIGEALKSQNKPGIKRITDCLENNEEVIHTVYVLRDEI